jgi:hypothetical protein
LTVTWPLIDHKPFNISRNQALLEREGDTVIVKDRGSSVGTHVNEVLIGARAAENQMILEDGDNILGLGTRRPRGKAYWSSASSPYKLHSVILHSWCLPHLWNRGLTGEPSAPGSGRGSPASRPGASRIADARRASVRGGRPLLPHPVDPLERGVMHAGARAGRQPHGPTRAGSRLSRGG